MAFDLRSWLTGFALGLCGKPLPLNTGRTPIAYSYNGTVLPKLPEWDREMYPFAVIFHSEYATNLIVFASEPCWYDGEGVERPKNTAYGSWAIVDGAWDLAGYLSPTYELGNPIVTNGYYPVWCNFDLLYKDSAEVYIAASEPVPVYE